MKRTIQRYSDAKLEKELAFARGFGAYDADSTRWLELLEAEATRRASQ